MQASVIKVIIWAMRVTSRPMIRQIKSFTLLEQTRAPPKRPTSVATVTASERNTDSTVRPAVRAEIMKLSQTVKENRRM